MNRKSIISLTVILISICLLSCTTKAVQPVVEVLTEEKSGDSVQQLIMQGRTEEARNLFQLKIDINETDINGNTALHSAAMVNAYDMVSFLVYNGADTELKNQDGDTALHLAIKNDAVKSAEILASLNSDIFAKDGIGKSALELGLEKGSLFFESLISNRTSTITDSSGQTIIHYFIKWENSQALDLAILKKLPLSIPDVNGITPLALCYKQCDSLNSVRMAANLLLANAAPLRGTFSYFEDAVKTRNPSIRFEDGQTPLHLASIQGQRGIVQYLVERGAQTKVKDVSGATPLHEAVRYGRLEIVRILLKAGADANAQDSLGKTPLLIISPQDTRTELYNLLLQYGANPNAKDMYGDTPLHIATMTGMNTAILGKLVNSGADINERNKKGVTPLALAVEHQWADHIDFYAQRGADIHAEDMNSMTPLTRALDTNLEVTQKLITASNCSTRDSYGNSPLHIAINRNAKTTQIKYILDIGADVNARNSNGDSPLYLAVQKNQRTVGELLLARKADVFATNTNNYSPLKLALTTGGDTQDWLLSSEVIKAVDGIGNTPLHYAAEWKLDNSVAVLLEKGAQPNVQNSNGETPLFFAVKADNPSTIKLLIAKGAKREQRDYLGNTPLHACVRWDARNAARLLISGGADVNAQNISGKTPLHEAARSNRLQMLNLLLDSNANINSSDITGKTVLIDAIQCNNPDVVKLLLKRGASPLIQEMYGRNAYHEAAASGNIELISLIREAGGNPLGRDTYGITPFSLALSQSSDVIKAVLGNDLNLADSDGNTPIHIAINSKISEEKLKMLIKMYYPVNRRNSTGVTPLSLAISTGQKELARILLENNADPYVTDNSGECAVSLAIKNNPDILDSIVHTTKNKQDMTGDGILHYAARTADAVVIKKLLSMGLDRSMRNISGELPYDIAIRWQRPTDIIELLK